MKWTLRLCLASRGDIISPANNSRMPLPFMVLSREMPFMTSRFKTRVALPILALCATWTLAVNVECWVVAQEPEPAAPAKEESWQVIYLSGQRIGFAHSVTETIKQDGRNVVRTSSDSHMTIKRFGQSLVMKQTVTTEESVKGDLFSFRYEMANPPASSTSTKGKVEGKELKLEQTVNGKMKESVQVWRPEVKSPAYQDRVLKTLPLKPGETRSFEAFMPDFGKVATIKLVAVDWEEAALLDGQKQRLLKVKMTQSLVPGLVLVGWVDDKGETLKSSTSASTGASFTARPRSAVLLVSYSRSFYFMKACKA